MSKYIKLNSAIRILWELGMPLCDYKSGAKQLESLSPIEIVHCEECQYWGTDGGALMVCGIHHYTTVPDHFCSYGERIDNE